MSVSATPTANAIDPRRPLAKLPALPQPLPMPQPAPAWIRDGYAPAVEEPRIAAQKRAVGEMFDRLAEDAKLAAVMLNPIFLPHAQAIASRATARAIVRYETEVPRKAFDALMREEQAAARAQILELPRRYYETGAEAIGTASDFVVQTAEDTGNALARGARTVSQGIVAGVVAVGGGIWAGIKASLRGLGSVFSSLGGALESAGS